MLAGAAVAPAVQASAQEWPDPVLPGMVKAPEIPADILPGWMGAMAGAVADSTQTPPALAVMVGLAVLAAVLQRRFEVSPFDDDYTEPLALWTLTALPSGARKSAVFSAMTAPLLRWEKREYDRGRAERGRVASARKVAEKRIERLLADAAKAKDEHERERIRAEIQHEKDTMPAELRAPRLFTEDVTAERLQAMLAEFGERMALLSDEAGIFQIMAGIYNGGSANLDAFLKGHAGTAMRVDRAGREAHVDKPALTFGLAMQPGVLAEVAASRRFRDSGLLARFLYAMPASNVGRRDVRRRVAVPDQVRDNYERAIFQLLEDVPAVIGKPRVLPMTEPALELWADFAQDIEDQQGEGGRYEAISDWTSKLPGAVARIAALIELAEVGRAAEEVSEVATRQAVALGRLLIPHAQAAFGLLGTDGVDTDGAAIVKWVQANGLAEFSRRECQKAMEGRFRSLERLNKALQRLQQQDVLRHYTRREKGKTPSEMHIVNPKLMSIISTLSP
ncbi:YfjI family protein [Thauera butanivorans]|uniref:YfjI family protein n=1 Tax=Thauera butanivorans TaxID=86174 RepID=UPI003AB5F593